MLKILIIDDDEIIRDALTLMLKQDNHKVTIATNGEEGISFYKEYKYDLIITDILMPGKNGIEFLIEMTNLNNTIPIVAMSGGRRAVTSDFNLSSAELLDVKATLTKPFTIEELKEVIQIALR